MTHIPLILFAVLVLWVIGMAGAEGARRHRDRDPWGAL